MSLTLQQANALTYNLKRLSYLKEAGVAVF